MNQGSMNYDKILSFVVKGYTSRNFFNADVISEKVRAGAATVGVKAKKYSADATAYAKSHPVNVVLLVTGACVLFAAYAYRTQLAAQFKRWS